MEQVGRLGRTLFVNDSKATNADAAEKALAAFPGGIHWVIGGVAKEGGVAPLAPLFIRVAKAYLIGQASDEFAATLEGRVPYQRCGNLTVAVEAAANDAERSESPEPVVLLSPACASYDQYPNFEVRGNEFRDLVLALPGILPVGVSHNPGA
jgi:UDP-N-acetylmuramoylalanine--D-glutamate ligase